MASGRRGSPRLLTAVNASGFVWRKGDPVLVLKRVGRVNVVIVRGVRFQNGERGRYMSSLPVFSNQPAELVDPHFVGIRRVPCQVESGWPVLSGTDRALPTKAGNEVAAW